MKVRDVIRRIEADGWKQVSQRGSHRQYKHPEKRGRVTVPGQLGEDLAKGTEKSIWQQAQIQKEQ